VTVKVSSSADELKEAAARLRRAVALDARHGDARIHYGRVLTLIGRGAAAIDELRDAVPLAKERDQQYYAQIFLGGALESVNDHGAAKSAYQAAANLFPQAQVPRLALSGLAAASGDRAGSLTALEPLLSAAEGDVQPDPWWTYFPSCGRGAPALLDEARQRLTASRAP
jgi:tetratricopeptide (TPR) repeat protein